MNSNLLSFSQWTIRIVGRTVHPSKQNSACPSDCPTEQSACLHFCAPRTYTGHIVGHRTQCRTRLRTVPSCDQYIKRRTNLNYTDKNDRKIKVLKDARRLLIFVRASTVRAVCNINYVENLVRVIQVRRLAPSLQSSADEFHKFYFSWWNTFKKTSEFRLFLLLYGMCYVLYIFCFVVLFAIWHVLYVIYFVLFCCYVVAMLCAILILCETLGMKEWLEVCYSINGA